MSRFSNLAGGDLGLKPPGGGPVRAKPAGGSFGVTTPLLDGTGGGFGVAKALLNAGELTMKQKFLRSRDFFQTSDAQCLCKVLTCARLPPQP